MLTWWFIGCAADSAWVWIAEVIRRTWICPTRIMVTAMAGSAHSEARPVQTVDEARFAGVGLPELLGAWAEVMTSVGTVGEVL